MEEGTCGTLRDECPYTFAAKLPTLPCLRRAANRFRVVIDPSVMLHSLSVDY